MRRAQEEIIGHLFGLILLLFANAATVATAWKSLGPVCGLARMKKVPGILEL